MKSLLLAFAMISSVSYARISDLENLDHPAALDPSAKETKTIEVSFDKAGENVLITYTTLEMATDGCDLAESNVDVIQPRFGLFVPKYQHTGIISFDTQVPEGSMCTMALRPNRTGTFVFPVSQVEGQFYELIIDGFSYGIITIDGDHVSISKKIKLLY